MKDPIPTFSHIIEQLAKNHPKLLYLHLVEARVFGDNDETAAQTANAQHPSSASADAPAQDSNEFARKIWGPDKPYLSAGGYSNAVQQAVDVAEKHDNVLLVFGRSFIANVCIFP